MKRRPPGRCPHLPYTSVWHSSLRPVPRACVCRRFLCRCNAPFDVFFLQAGTCQPQGVSPVAGPSAHLCTCLSLPEFSSEYWHFPVLGFLSGGFSRKGKRLGHLYYLTVARPGNNQPRYLTMLAPFGSLSPPPPFPHLHPPLVIVIPSSLVEEVWGVAL